MSDYEILEVLKNNIKDMYKDMPTDDVKSEYYKAGARKAIKRVLIQIDLLKPKENLCTTNISNKH